MDILDRRDQYSWLSSEHQGKPWHSAEIAPSEFLNFAADELAVVASGRYSDLTPYHREGLEAMLIHGMSRRDDMFDQDLHRISEKAMGGPKNLHIPESGRASASDFVMAEDLVRKQEAARFGINPNERSEEHTSELQVRVYPGGGRNL